jgi:hypothetical protein
MTKFGQAVSIKLPKYLTTMPRILMGLRNCSNHKKDAVRIVCGRLSAAVGIATSEAYFPMKITPTVLLAGS